MVEFSHRPGGYLYDKEAILECLLHQKRESKWWYWLASVFFINDVALDARKMKEFEKQKSKHKVGNKMERLSMGKNTLYNKDTLVSWFNPIPLYFVHSV